MKTPDQFSTKQLLDLFDSGEINVEQLNHLVRTLRTGREEYARQAEEYQRKYQREHIETNRWKNRAELAEARIKLANEQEPYGWDSSGDLVYHIENGLKNPAPIPLYAHPLPAQAENPLVDAVFAASHKKATDTHGKCPNCSHECAQAIPEKKYMIDPCIDDGEYYLLGGEINELLSASPKPEVKFVDLRQIVNDGSK